MSEPDISNMHQWMVIHMKVGDSLLTWHALQQSWRTTLDPHNSYSRRRITDGILDKLLEGNANAEPIAKESAEKKKKGYCFIGDPETPFGPPIHSYFHEQGDNDSHEMEYRHPGTSEESDIEDDDKVIHYNIHYNEVFSPITTVAGQYITSITFAAPQDENNVINRCDMYPAYEMQYSIRTDDKRKFLFYDSFEYNPKRWDVETGVLPTNKEYRKAMEVLNMGPDHSPWDESDSEDEGEDDNSPVELKPISDQIKMLQAKSGVKLFTHAGEFMQSRVYRIQVPLANVSGLRVHSPPKNDAESEDEDEDEDGSVEKNSEDKAFLRMEKKMFTRDSPQSVLIIELQQPASNFAVRRVLSNHQGDNKFSQIDDWSPHKVASRATRHYIVGNKEEINGMASHLASLLEIDNLNEGAEDDSSGKHGSTKAKKPKREQKKSVEKIRRGISLERKSCSDSCSTYRSTNEHNRVIRQWEWCLSKW